MEKVISRKPETKWMHGVLQFQKEVVSATSPVSFQVLAKGLVFGGWNSPQGGIFHLFRVSLPFSQVLSVVGVPSTLTRHSFIDHICPPFEVDVGAHLLRAIHGWQKVTYRVHEQRVKF